MSLSTRPEPDERLVRARQATRTVERYCYGELMELPEGSSDFKEMRDIVRQAVGLRRMLDRYKELSNGEEHTG